MRYYVYVSDTKLDMLAPQVPRKLRERVAAELTIDLKVLSLSLKENPSDANRYAKVELVRQHLLKDGAVGTVDDDTAWFAGTMPMHWGPFQHHTRAEYDPNFPMVFFAGQTETMQLGLGGSRRHLLGEQSSLSERVRDTPMGPLFTSFSDGYSILRAVRDPVRDEHDAQSPAAPKAVASTVAQVIGTAELSGLPASSMEFLARRLIDVPSNGFPGPRRVILGTPLYVVQAD
jgi:hypothetical protein